MPTRETPIETPTTEPTVESNSKVLNPNCPNAIAVGTIVETIVETRMKVLKPDGTFETLTFTVDPNQISSNIPVVQNHVVQNKEFFVKFDGATTQILTSSHKDIKVKKVRDAKYNNMERIGIYEVTLPFPVPMNSVAIAQLHLHYDNRTTDSRVNQNSTTVFKIICFKDLERGDHDHIVNFDVPVSLLIKVGDYPKASQIQE